MDRTMLCAVVCIGIMSLAAAVTASPRMSNTPLYTVRMEQASSNMHFLPTTVNDFTYTAENKYTLHYDIFLDGHMDMVRDVPDTESTCYGWTCFQTCTSTCPYTCYTCPNTCQHTCQITCWAGCYTADTKPC